mgnify:CR=1 FL=1
MSRIRRVEVHEYTFDIENLDHHRAYQPGARLTLSNFGVRILTDDGSVGEYCPQHGGKKAHLGQVLMAAPQIVGRNALERAILYDDMKRALRQLGFLGVGHLDIALWDLAARRYGVSVGELLGAYRTRVPAYASTTHGDREGALSSPEHFAAFAEQCHDLGFRAFKIHGWNEGDAREEAANVTHLAKSVGDRMTLMIDPACQLRTFADALYVGRACDDANFFWYEDPMRDGGVSMQAHRKLRQMIRTPLLITEHVRGVEAKADWIVHEATDFVRADPDMDLGITGTMRIAHLADAFGLDVELHGCGPAHRLCMAAIRNTNYYELAIVNPKARNPVPPIYRSDYSDQLEDVGADGCYPVPTGPGLGVDYDWDFIERNRTALHVFE